MRELRSFGLRPGGPIPEAADKFLAAKHAIRHPFPIPPGRLWKGPPALEEAIQKSIKVSAARGGPNPTADGLVTAAQPGSKPEDFIQKTRFEFIHRAVAAGLQRPDDNSLALTDRLDAHALPGEGLDCFRGPDAHCILVHL